MSTLQPIPVQNVVALCFFFVCLGAAAIAWAVAWCRVEMKRAAEDSANSRYWDDCRVEMHRIDAERKADS